MNDFFASIFELGGLTRNDFSDSVYDYGLYTTTGLTMVFLTIFVIVLYYYVINSPRYNKFAYWLMTGTISSLIIALVLFFMTKSKFTYEELGFVLTDYLQFAIVVFAFSLVSFFIFSLLLKHWSTNCKDSPFRTRK